MMTEDKSKKTTEESLNDKITLSDVAKKAFYTGLGAIFMTEETVRNALSDVKIPKDAIIDNVKKAKEEFFQILFKELHNAFNKIDISEEARRFLEKHTVEIKAELNFKPKKD